MMTPSQNGRAIALLSGGLDSTVSLADALTRHAVVKALTFDYGQRAAQSEIRASRALAAYYGLDLEIVELPWLAAMLPQALSRHADTAPERTRPQDGAVSETTRRVWVPNRNGVFINIAAAYAEAMDAPIILFGANADEAAGFPDNTQAYRDAVNRSLTFSTLSHVQVETPLGGCSKKAIIKRGKALNVPLDLIWSCYEGGLEHCGVCPSCVLLRDALAESGEPVYLSFLSEES